MRQSQYQEGIKKTHRFSRPPFFRFWLILNTQGGQKVYVARPCFGSFPIFGAMFFARAPLWAILMDFVAFGTIFACFFLNSLALNLANAVAFCGQDYSRNRQGSLKILAGAAKILSNSLHICERQE